uniref:RxLR effector protein n=1 Tax=Peronospora matthiolae TaxID=2874970 RepID=A0AAV1TMI8_9STRA
MRLPYLAVAALAAVFASSNAVPSTAAEPDVSFVDRVKHDRVNEADAKRVLRSAGASSALPSVPANTEEERAGFAPFGWVRELATRTKGHLDEALTKVTDYTWKGEEIADKRLKRAKEKAASWWQKADGKNRVDAVKDLFRLVFSEKAAAAKDQSKVQTAKHLLGRIFTSSKNAAANDVKAAPGAV